MPSYGREDEKRSRGCDDRGEGGRGSLGGGRDDGRRDSFGSGREDSRRDSYSEDRRDDLRGRSSHRRDDIEDRSSSTSGYRVSSRDDEDRKPLHNQGEVQEAPMPGGWQVVEDSGVPSWDPDSLLQEPRPEGWCPPTPEPVPRTLVPFKESFETETADPPRFDIADKETILRQNRDIDEREPLVVLNNLCVVRTHLRGIMDSKRRREEEDREEEGDFRNNGFRGRGGGRGGRGGGGGGRGGGGRGRGGGGFNGGREEGGDPNTMPVGERKRFGEDGDQNLLVRGYERKMEAAGSRSSGMRDMTPPFLEERRPSSPRDRRLPSPRDKRPPSPRERRPTSPRERRPPSPRERRPPFQRERRPSSPRERRLPSPMSKRPPSPRDRRPPSPRGRPPSLRDRRPPSPIDRRPPSPSMESRYSRGTLPPSPKDRRKSYVEDFDRPRSPHRARDDSSHATSHSPGRLPGDGDKRYATQGRGNVASSGTAGRGPALTSTTKRLTGGSTPGTPGISSSDSGMTYKEWKERRAREKAAGQ